MNKLIYIISILILSTLWSCTKEFESINTNPNAPTDVQPGLLLRKVIWDYAENMAYEGFVSGGLLSQHFTAIDFNLFDRHSLLEPQFGGNPWPVFYNNLRDNEIILNKSLENPTFEVYEGPSRILKAYMASVLTDIFGDVPYLEAFKGKAGYISPKYDSQEDIYLGQDGILENIDLGISAIQNYNSNIPLEGDILFNGQLDQWIKFANSLKIKVLMRISSKINIENQIQEIYESGQYIQSSGDNATFDFTSNEPNNFRLSTARIGDFTTYIMSLTSEEILKAYSDPRIEVFFRATLTDPNDFKGLLNGPDASQLSISVADYSLAGTIFREETQRLDANYLTSWETHFLLSEAAIKGYIEADPKELYNQGVRQSFEYWGAEMPETYLTSGKTAFNEIDGLEQIITQKWISSYVNGYEGWIEWKRTGFPALKSVAASLNNDLIPVRMPYPIDEAALNADNYQIASGLSDGNSINFPVWWME